MSTILLKIDDHIATVTINNPQVLNALSTEVLTDLNQTFDEIEKAKDVYAVIITGAGEKSFVAGADISEMKDKNKAQAAEYGAFGNKVFLRIENFPCPVIAAINGRAKELIYTCRQVKADEALSIGLVNAVTEPEKLMEEALRVAKMIAANAPIAVRYAKQAINEGLQTNMQGGVDIEVEKFSGCFATEDQKMAMTAFVKKEKIEKFNNR